MRNLTMALVAVAAVAMLAGQAGAAVIGVDEAYGHNEAENYGGTIEDMIIGSGMNGYGYDGTPGWPAGEGDPSTWTATSSHYKAEWQSQDLLGADESPTNGKIGWTIFDVGESNPLDELSIWHTRQGTASGTAATNFNVYVAETPSVAPTHGPTNSTSIDYDFSSGGWTAVSSGVAGSHQGTTVVDLSGNSGQFIGLEIIESVDDGNNKVGFAEVGVTVVPEPASLALIGIGGIGVLLRRRRA